MTAADRIFAFLIDRCPVDKASPYLRAWFDWYWRDGRVVAVQERGAIVGAALLRRVANATEADANQDAHRDDAPLLWIEWAANTAGARGWAVLSHLVAQRFPQLPPMCAFNRYGRDARAARILQTDRYFERLAHG